MAENVGFLDKLRRRARDLKVETLALYHVARDPRVPWYARLFVGIVVAYALSPIDLIPDFVPILGYLDDLILVPLGIALALRMVPTDVLADCRARASAELDAGHPASRAALLAIIGIWLASAALAAWLVARALWA
jgi:uncharacterized membrane protein YkvA (DUF1232 family)